MKKLILRTLLIMVIILLCGILLYINYIAPGITGYAAKSLASGVFVAGRTQESIEKEDINFFPVQFSKNTVDFENMEVTSRFLLWKSKAVFNEGLGSTLVTDFSGTDVERLDYPAFQLPEGDPDTIPWPAGDLLSDTVPSGINIQLLSETLDRVFKDTAVHGGTFAVTVVYKDQIVAERYRSDFSPEIRFLSWSMAKSFTNTMVGTMVKEGLVDIDKPLGLEQWADDDRNKITLRHLMNMNSGLEFNEKYSKLKLTDATTMLLKNGNMFEYAISKDLVAEPGTLWSYSSGSSNIIQGWLRSVIGDDAKYHSWPRTALFNRIGMRSAVWEVDASGTFVGSSYLYATMRDYARYGLLYLHDGNWLGEQVLPEGWVKFTSTPAEG
ncbi:MAG: beta-lactamase family protein, partial [Bacteroidales bacterium]|nr:beta-lactamase family protein [Bacteroidales bacterium]